MTLGTIDRALMNDLMPLRPRDRAQRVRQLALLGLSVEAGLMSGKAANTVLLSQVPASVTHLEAEDESFKESLAALGV